MPLLRSAPRPDDSDAVRRSRHRSAAASALALFLAAAAGTFASGSTGWAAGAAGSSGNRTPSVAARSNPPVSIKPSAAFSRYCFTTGHVLQCDTAAIADIDRGLAAEHLRRLVLPTSLGTFASWGQPRQLRVVADLERRKRGLPTLSNSNAFDRLAETGAAHGVDPTGPAGYGWGSVISWGYATPLAADFAWMYDDGPGSSNIDCTSPAAAGCWGHRDNILLPWGGHQGAGAFDNHGREQLTELFVED